MMDLNGHVPMRMNEVGSVCTLPWIAVGNEATRMA